MARLYVAPDRLSGTRVVLRGSDHHHIVRVLRLRAGAPLVVFDGLGNEWNAQLVTVGARDAQLELGSPRPALARAAPPVVLLVGLPKANKMDWIIEKTTELGVSRVVPLLCERSIVQGPAGAAENRRARWLKIAEQAARQSGRSDVPGISAPIRFAEALAELAPGGLRFLFWEDPSAPWLERKNETERPPELVAMVGPEGSFAPGERQSACEHGFTPVGLGPATLRVETAALAAVTLLGYLWGRTPT